MIEQGEETFELRKSLQSEPQFQGQSNWATVVLLFVK